MSFGAPITNLLPRASLLLVLASIFLASVVTPVAAAPESSPETLPTPPLSATFLNLPSGDPVSRFLAEKGLFGAVTVSAPPSESAFVERMRDQASDMVLTAMYFLGVPYRRGGESAERGFDCSGFTRKVFESSLGLILPRRADEQAQAPGFIPVKRDELKPGDLVFFNTLRRTFSHVGIYIGDGKFIHAPRTGGEVRVEDMSFKYWTKRFTGARRAQPLVDVPAEVSNDPLPSATALTPALR